MSSSNYIRIYCNGEKVRSTGKEKWQRDDVLRNFGIFGLYPFLSLWRPPICNEIPANILAKYEENKEDIHFKIEYIRKTSKGKRVIGTFIVPFYLMYMKNNGFFVMPESDLMVKSGDELIFYESEEKLKETQYRKYALIRKQK